MDRKLELFAVVNYLSSSVIIYSATCFFFLLFEIDALSFLGVQRIVMTIVTSLETLDGEGGGHASLSSFLAQVIPCIWNFS